MIKLVIVQIGHLLYEEVMGPIRTDPILRQQLWDDAEHALDEAPSKLWVMVLHDGVPAAWAAAVVERHDGAPVLRCCDNYERRGPGRDRRLYPAAYRHRHERIVAPCGLPAVTYLGREPIPLHEADGWYRTGVHGVSDATGLAWWELRRPATA